MRVRAASLEGLALEGLAELNCTAAILPTARIPSNEFSDQVSGRGTSQRRRGFLHVEEALSKLCLRPPSSSRGLGGLLLLRLAMATQKKRVSYYYDPDIGNFYYGQVGERTPARSRAVLPLPLRPPSTRVWVGPTRGPARVLALHTLSGAALCPAVCAGASDEAAPHPGRPPPHRGTCAPRVPAQACDSSSPALRAPAFSFLVPFVAPVRRRTICTGRWRCSGRPRPRLRR